MSKYITDDVEISSDEENSDEENSDKDNSDEENYSEECLFWKGIKWLKKQKKKHNKVIGLFRPAQKIIFI